MRKFFFLFALIATAAHGMGGAVFEPIPLDSESNLQTLSTGDACPVQKPGYRATLETKYCSRLMPQKAEYAFYPGFDLPAESLRTPISSLASAWRRHEWWPEDSPAKVMDWSAVKKMNIDSAAIWEEILACSPNAEHARAGYFNGELCGDSPKHEELKQKVTGLHADVLAFLTTSNVIPAKHQFGGLLDFHPFFIQVVLETLAVARPYDFPDPTIVRIIKTIPTKGVIYITPADEERRMISHLKNTNSILFNYVEDNPTVTARLLHNLSALLTHASSSQCEQWGFWPGIARVIVARQGYYQVKSDWTGRGNILAACGAGPGGSTYSEWSIDSTRYFIQQYGRLFQNYSKTN